MPPAAANVMDLWRGFIEEQASGTLDNLETALSDQGQFAKFARQIISDLGYGDQLGNDPDMPDEDQEDQAQEDQDEDQDPDSTRDDDSQDDEAEANPEQSQEQQQDAAEAQISQDDSADDDISDEMEMPEGMHLDPPRRNPFRMLIQTMPFITQTMTKKFMPKNWQNPSNWNVCAPIWINNLNR